MNFAKAMETAPSSVSGGQSRTLALVGIWLHTCREPPSAVHANRRDSAAIVVGDQRFLLDLGNHEHALVAKFTLPEASRPVILICGQTPITNRAAIHYLKREYRALWKTVASVDQFCIMVRVTSTGTYGYQAADLECDVSAAAFTGH
jgi:hypothetical protein